MTKVDLFDINIPKWEKFNPRNDRGNFAWFRFQNTFFTDQAIFGVSNEAKLLFIFLCCEASKNNCGNLKLNSSYISALLNFKPEKIRAYIDELSLNGLVELLNGSSRISERKSQVPYVRTDVRDVTDVRNVTDVTVREPAHVFDFEAVWEILPTGIKQEARKRFEKYIKTDDQYAKILLATKNYVDECVANNQFTKHLSSFIGSSRTTHPWVEFIEPRPVGPPRPGQKTKLQIMSENNQRMFDMVERGEI